MHCVSFCLAIKITQKLFGYIVRISASIVAYKTAPMQLRAVLSSIRDASATVDIIVVDHSPSTVLQMLVEEYGGYYFSCPDNPGFGAGHNRAMNFATELSSDYHFVINPDIVFGTGVIRDMISYMEVNRGIGLLSPRIRYPDGRIQTLCKLLPTPVDLFLRRFLPGIYRHSGMEARYELHASGYDQIMDVPSLSGCFMLFRFHVLKSVGFFDTRFYMYMEDVDLCRRVGQCARTVFYPNVDVVHDYAKGSYRNPKLLFFHLRSAMQYFNKWGWFFDAKRRAVNCAASEMVAAIVKSEIIKSP